MVALYSILLAGGSGSRLWPMSREMFPKQMFKLDDEYTLFQKTFLNLSNFVDDKNIITSTNKGEPVVNDEKSLAGMAYINVAKRITGEDVPLLDIDEPPTLIDKIKKFFAKKA